MFLDVFYTFCVCFKPVFLFFARVSMKNTFGARSKLCPSAGGCERRLRLRLFRCVSRRGERGGNACAPLPAALRRCLPVPCWPLLRERRSLRARCTSCSVCFLSELMLLCTLELVVGELRSLRRLFLRRSRCQTVRNTRLCEPVSEFYVAVGEG